MPYANEHSCRVREPGDFQQDSFRRISQKTEDGKRIDLIIGKLEGESDTTVQAFRYPKDEWSEDEARKHCNGHDGILFEPASGEEKDSDPVPYACTSCACHAEQRTAPLAGLSVRSENGQPTIRWYPAVWDEWSEDLGGFKEIVRRGAFRRSLKGADVRALFNHNADYVLGRTTSGTLTLKEDDTGLLAVAKPPDAQWARDLVESIKRGDINQGSFGFVTVRDKWSSQGNMRLRELLEADLRDVSIVTFPAYPATKAEVRAISSEDKSALKAELKELNMTDLVATHRRLHQFAAQGHLLTGFTKADMEWFHNAVEDELKRRAEEEGREPSEPSPLEWGELASAPAEETDDDRHFPSQVGKIAAKAKKKGEKKSVEPAWDLVARVLEKAECGEPLSIEDRRLIQASIDALRSYLPSDEAQGSQSDATPAQLVQGNMLQVYERLVEIASKRII